MVKDAAAISLILIQAAEYQVHQARRMLRKRTCESSSRIRLTSITWLDISNIEKLSNEIQNIKMTQLYQL